MKNINIKKITLIVGLVSVLFSCSKSEETVTTKNNSKLEASSTLYKRGAKIYSGAEIVEGLFFFKNDVASGIPQLAQIKSQITNYPNYLEVSNSMDELSTITINFINKRYPTYLNELQKKMYSGNLFEIGNALEQTSKYIEQAGLASTKYQSAFILGKKIDENENLRAQITALDLSTKAGINQLNKLVKTETRTNIETSNGRCVFFAGALAVVYVGAIAVSIAVAAYSVYYKVAYWGPSGCRCSTNIGEISNIYVSGGGVEFEREILIGQIGKFFKP